GIVGIEAAIVLIAFVIIAAAFAFMAINMGLFATQRSKDTIAQGLRESSSPLQLDGNIFLRVNGTNMRVEAIIIPLRAMGVKYVPMGTDQTVVSISIPGRTARASIYRGVNNETSSTWSPQNKTFDNLVIKALNKTGIDGWIYNETYTDYTEEGHPHPNATIAYLLVENSDGDEALDASEKGFLVITLNCTEDEYAQPRDIITIEIRVEKSAPLTIEFMVPESLTTGVWTMVSG
ncbi:MAG: archaellin/type IV pilin N-terminal domain-containing protein, partial [Candidatus Freyarchaeota archaeon]